ncbi:MAG TPA: hypothetical protein VGV89_06350 [Thermoplasmata archaeon]|nr:hypothetical protein [Thermoplasmata archaeon]
MTALWTRRGGRIAGHAAGAALAAATVLLLVVAGGGLSSPVITLRAPYRGSHAALYDGVSPLLPGPCGSTSLTRHSVWSPTSGAVYWSGTAVARNSPRCSASITSAAWTNEYVAIPLHPPKTTGTYSIHGTWKLSALATWSLRHLACPTPIYVGGTGGQVCAESVYIYGAPSNYLDSLIDLTTQSTIGYSSSANSPISLYADWSHTVHCYQYNCTKSNSSTGPQNGSAPLGATWNSWWNATSLNASHRYAIEFVFGWSVEAGVVGGPRTWSALAAASLSLSGAGRGAYLSSITIS